jgi:hypothetical protein
MTAFGPGSHGALSISGPPSRCIEPQLRLWISRPSVTEITLICEMTPTSTHSASASTFSSSCWIQLSGRPVCPPEVSGAGRCRVWQRFATNWDIVPCFPSVKVVETRSPGSRSEANETVRALHQPAELCVPLLGSTLLWLDYHADCTMTMTPGWSSPWAHLTD